MARYNLLPNLTSSMRFVSGSGGGLAVVINPPASLKIQIPAATSLFQVSHHPLPFALCQTRKTYHSQQPPSHQISNAPAATYAKSNVALPKLLTPCTIPPFPPRPPISAAIFIKLPILRCIFPSAISRLSFPHSQLKIHPFGAFGGSTCFGELTYGSTFLFFVG